MRIEVRNLMIWFTQLPTNDFCDANYCYASIEGIPLYRDFDHLNGYGSNFLIQKMTSQLEMLK